MQRYFSVDRREDAIIATITDAHLNSAALADFITLELLEMLKTGPVLLVIDFQNVKSISSSAIDGFLHVVRQSNVPLRLCSMSASLREIFRIIKLDGTVFEIFDSVEDALNVKPHSYFEASGKYSPPDEEFDDTSRR